MWDELYERHHAELLRWCVGTCRNEALAEDLVQETFLRALQDPDTLEDLGPSQRRAWLYRTIKRLLIDRLRRGQLEERYIQTFPAETVQRETGFDAAENALLLASLTPQDRALFHLRYMEGYTAAELAQLFDLPAGTVRSKLSRARKLLQTAIMEE